MSRNSSLLYLVMLSVMFVGLAIPCVADLYQPKTIHDVDLLSNGNILVTDGGDMGSHLWGGVYEINRQGSIVWSYTTGLLWAHNADRQTDGRVIISDTDNDRVIIVSTNGSILWSTETVVLDDGSELRYPNDANLLPLGTRLITDRDNHRVIEINEEGNIVWQFGETGIPGNDGFHLNRPHNADRLSGENTIIADSENNRIIEVDPYGAIVWTYTGGLDWPRDADRLTTGNTLINDSRNHRIIEITPVGEVVWEHPTDDMSYDSDRLDNGNTFFGASGVIREVTPSGETVWSYPRVYETEVVEGYLVIAPNGNRLWTKIIQPKPSLYPGQKFPTIVNVSGGLNSGENGNLRMAGLGFVEVHFNAEGRGEQHPSDGEEGQNGFVQQDDLKAMIEFVHTRPNVMTDNVGVVTHSYGITMGAGCLGRYTGLKVKYLIDCEGPSESFVTCKEPWSLDEDPSNDMHEFIYGMFGHYSTYRDSSPENWAWWSEREATRFIGGIRCRYLRIQAEWDHAQPPNEQWPGFDYPPLWYQCKHGVDLVNLATGGSSPWTRVNGFPLGNEPNMFYSREHPPVYYDRLWSDHEEELGNIIREMAAMEALSADGDDVTGLATTIALLPIYPNPFSDKTTLSYSLTEPVHVVLKIYGVDGRRVSTLANGWQSAGIFTSQWNGAGDGDGSLPSGPYLARLSITGEDGNTVNLTRRLLIVR